MYQLHHRWSSSLLAFKRGLENIDFISPPKSIVVSSSLSCSFCSKDDAPIIMATHRPLPPSETVN
jgi:hypothetical protein